MIKLNINHTRISTSNLKTLVVGNVNSIFIEFSFSPEWEALEKVAVLSNGTSRVSIPVSGDTCVIPWEVLACTGELLISLRGVGDGGNYVLCTENASLGKVEDSLADDDANTPESATPDIIDTLIADVAELKTGGLGGVVSKTDLAGDVQTSLGKADTALQEHQSLAAYRTSVDQDVIDNGKQAKITTSGLLKADGNGNVSAAVEGTDYLTLATIPQEIFFAEYNVATFADIAQAIAAGKKVQVKREASGNTYIYDLTYVSATVMRFGQISNAYLYTCSVSSENAWSRADTAMSDIARVANTVSLSQGVSHAGEFLVVGSDGKVTTTTLSALQGDSH